MSDELSPLPLSAVFEIRIDRLRGYPVRVRRERAAVVGTLRHGQDLFGRLLRCRVRLVRARVLFKGVGGAFTIHYIRYTSEASLSTTVVWFEVLFDSEDRITSLERDSLRVYSLLA